LTHLFSFNDTPPTEIYTLSLHDALPIYPPGKIADRGVGLPMLRLNVLAQAAFKIASAGMPVEIAILDVDHARNSVRRAKVVMERDRKSTRLNSSHVSISYAVFCLKKKKQ